MKCFVINVFYSIWGQQQHKWRLAHKWRFDERTNKCKEKTMIKNQQPAFSMYSWRVDVVLRHDGNVLVGWTSLAFHPVTCGRGHGICNINKLSPIRSESCNRRPHVLTSDNGKRTANAIRICCPSVFRMRSHLRTASVRPSCRICTRWHHLRVLKNKWKKIHSKWTTLLRRWSTLRIYDFMPCKHTLILKWNNHNSCIWRIIHYLFVS